MKCPAVSAVLFNEPGMLIYLCKRSPSLTERLQELTVVVSNFAANLDATIFLENVVKCLETVAAERVRGFSFV